MSSRPDRDPHARFENWLLGGAAGEPPRDLAVHASVCPACGGAIAAFDALAAIDPGSAMLPPSRAAATAPGRLGSGSARVLIPAGGIVAAGAVVAIGFALLSPPGPGGLGTDAGPTQDVLGGTGRPSPSGADATGLHGGELTGSPTPEASATATPQPSATLRPTAPANNPTAAPTAPTAPTAPPTPPPTAEPTTNPTATPGPSATATPAPTPTPEPTPTPTPTPEPTPTPTPEPSSGL
jgi:hypothetical protein